MSEKECPASIKSLYPTMWTISLVKVPYIYYVVTFCDPYFPTFKEGALCVEMVFYGDISWESGCNIEINVWTHFYKILLVFEVPY